MIGVLSLILVLQLVSAASYGQLWTQRRNLQQSGVSSVVGDLTLPFTPLTATDELSLSPEEEEEDSDPFGEVDTLSVRAPPQEPPITEIPTPQIPDFSGPLPLIPMAGVETPTPSPSDIPAAFTFQPTQPIDSLATPPSTDTYLASRADLTPTPPSLPELPPVVSTQQSPLDDLVGLPTFTNFPSPSVSDVSSSYQQVLETLGPLSVSSTVPAITPTVAATPSPAPFALPGFDVQTTTSTPEVPNEPPTGTLPSSFPFLQTEPSPSLPVQAPTQPQQVCEEDQEYDLQAVVIQQFCVLNNLLELRLLEADAMNTCCQVTSSLIRSVTQNPECHEPCKFNGQSESDELDNLVDLWRAICRVDPPPCNLEPPTIQEPVLTPLTSPASVLEQQDQFGAIGLPQTQSPLDLTSQPFGSEYENVYSQSIAPVGPAEPVSSLGPPTVPSPTPPSDDPLIPGLGLSVPALQQQLQGFTMWEVVQTVPSLTDLVALVQAVNIQNIFNNPFQPVTLFAPTNDALAEFASVREVSSAADLAQYEEIEEVLRYHVVVGEVLIGQIEQQRSLESLQGANFTVQSQQQGGQSNIYLTGCCQSVARVIVADAKASTGVFHAIDSILEPPSK